MISAVTAVLAVLVFERFSNKQSRTRAMRQILANLLAIRLFSDEPRIVLDSLLGVIAANARLLASVIKPMVILAPIFYLSYRYLDGYFGYAPSLEGTARVLTVQLSHVGSEWPEVRLKTPDWIQVDSPPVHVFDDKQISWRLRATRSCRGMVQVIAGKETIEKPVNFLSAAAPLSVYGFAMGWSSWLAVLSLLCVLPVRWCLRMASRILPVLSSIVSR